MHSCRHRPASFATSARVELSCFLLQINPAQLCCLRIARMLSRSNFCGDVPLVSLEKNTRTKNWTFISASKLQNKFHQQPIAYVRQISINKNWTHLHRLNIFEKDGTLATITDTKDQIVIDEPLFRYENNYDTFLLSTLRPLLRLFLFSRLRLLRFCSFLLFWILWKGVCFFYYYCSKWQCPCVQDSSI